MQPQLPGDCQQLVDAVRARVPGPDGGETAAVQRLAEPAVAHDLAQERLHLRAVARDEEVLAWPEEPLGVVPRRADQRDPARQGLERADRGDARERLDVRAAR